MNNFTDETINQSAESTEESFGVAKVEKISLTEISQEIEKKENEKTEELVKRIIKKISEID